MVKVFVVQGRQVHVHRAGGLLGFGVEGQFRTVDPDGRQVIVAFLLAAAGEDGARQGEKREEAYSEFHIAVGYSVLPLREYR